MPLLPPVTTAILLSSKDIFSIPGFNVRTRPRCRGERRRLSYRGIDAVPPLVVPPPVPSVRCDRERSQRCRNPFLQSRRRRPRARDEVSPALGPNGSLCLPSEIPIGEIGLDAHAVRPRHCGLTDASGRQSWDQPPSTGSSAPLVKVASNARKRTAF